MGNLINYGATQKGPITWSDWLKLGEKEKIERYASLIRKFIPYNRNKVTFDTFTNYLKYLIDDYENRLKWNLKFNLTINYNQKIEDETIDALKLVINKLTIENNLKQNEIDLRDNNISKNQYNIKKRNNKRKISHINDKIKSHPRKIRRLTINYKKDIEEFENNFKTKNPFFYKRVKEYEKSAII